MSDITSSSVASSLRAQPRWNFLRCHCSKTLRHLADSIINRRRDSDRSIMLSLIKVFVRRSINKGKTQQEELEHRLPESVCQLEAQNLDRLPAYPMLSVTGVIKVWSLRAQDFLRAGSNLGMERSALTQQCRTKN